MESIDHEFDFSSLTSLIKEELRASSEHEHAVLSQQLSEKTEELNKERRLVEELQKQVSAKTAELETARKERATAEQTVGELKLQLELSSASLTEKQLEAKAASEDAELTLLQLHQSQEGLEHYFFESRAKDELLKKYQAQQKRVKSLISRILTSSQSHRC